MSFFLGWFTLHGALGWSCFIFPYSTLMCDVYLWVAFVASMSVALSFFDDFGLFAKLRERQKLRIYGVEDGMENECSAV